MVLRGWGGPRGGFIQIFLQAREGQGEQERARIGIYSLENERTCNSCANPTSVLKNKNHRFPRRFISLVLLVTKGTTISKQTKIARGSLLYLAALRRKAECRRSPSRLKEVLICGGAFFWDSTQAPTKKTIKLCSL